MYIPGGLTVIVKKGLYGNVFLPVLLKGQLNLITYLQKLSPFEDGDDMQVPSCLQGLGEQETKPESGKIRNVSDLSSCQAVKKIKQTTPKVTVDRVLFCFFLKICKPSTYSRGLCFSCTGQDLNPP